MEAKSPPTRLFSKFLGVILAVTLSAAHPIEAKAQSNPINPDLGTFVSYVCGNFPTTNWAAVLQDILNQLLSIQFQMQGLGSSGGGIGDPSQCIPGFNAQMPSLPGLGNLAACLNIGGFGNFGANIGNCLNGVLGQFGDLSQYFGQFNWNYQSIMQCLQGLVTIPTISLPDFLSNLSSVLSNIIGLLNTLLVSSNTYGEFYNFFFSFCNSNYNANGFVGGGGGGGGGFSNTVAVNGSSVQVTSGLVGGGGPGAVSNAAVVSAVAVVKPQKGKAKQYPMAFNASNQRYSRTIKNLKKGKNTISINLMSADGVPVSMSKTSVTIK